LLLLPPARTGERAFRAAAYEAAAMPEAEEGLRGEGGWDCPPAAALKLADKRADTEEEEEEEGIPPATAVPPGAREAENAASTSATSLRLSKLAAEASGLDEGKTSHAALCLAHRTSRRTRDRRLLWKGGDGRR
jgi:hypothetical protein